MPRDVEPTADPDPVMLEDVIEEPRQRSRARRPSSHARMKPDRHQGGPFRALLVELVERRLQIGLKIRGRGETRGGRELSVVGLHRIGNHEMALSADMVQ